MSDIVKWYKVVVIRYYKITICKYNYLVFIFIDTDAYVR